MDQNEMDAATANAWLELVEARSTSVLAYLEKETTELPHGSSDACKERESKREMKRLEKKRRITRRICARGLGSARHEGRAKITAPRRRLVANNVCACRLS